MTVLAPAKLNLTLEVLAERQDGFHEIRSVIQTIDLADRLRFQSGENIKYMYKLSEWVPEASLIPKAIRLLQRTTGCNKGVTIEVDKRIPLLSGLGGDSSDAAAVLRGLNQLWRLGLSHDDLLELAWQLGSDVAFFLYGGTALLEGRGEIVTPLPPLPHRWVVLMVPSVPRQTGKTKRLYDSLRDSHYTDGEITRRLVEEIREGRIFIPPIMFNTFENVAFLRSMELSLYRDHIGREAGTDVYLAGSGPALFALLEDKVQAEDIFARLRQRRLGVYLAETLSAIEPIA